MIGFLGGIVLIASLCISMAIPASEWAFPFVHAALEALGSFLAIVVAWHSLTTYLANPHESHRVWVGLAFLNMGILYGLHALVAPGDLSIWFRSCATFIGGVMAMLVWIPSPAHRKVPVGWALIICISSYPLLGIVFFRNPQLVPYMIDQKDMTWVTTLFTVSGGAAFLGSAVWFLRHLKHSSHWEPMRQASCYVSIGMSEICFTWSTLWDPMWWWWHGVRLFSYGIVAYSAKADFEQGLIRQTELALEAEENARFRFVVQSAPCGMLMVGSDGTISMVNRQLEVLFGYDRNELVGSPNHTLLPERFRTTLPGIEELHIPASFPLISVRHGRALFGLRKDETEFPIEVGFSHIELNSAKQILATVVDITERKQAELQVIADPVQLAQVFQNLISNALKFRGGRRPVIHVSARHSNERQAPIQWMFSIQDNGIGFESQFQKRVFVIFQRLHTREEYEGNGIGLAITKKIIERHGGTIWVESTPGTGTTFFFTLRGHVSERVDAAA